MTREARAKVNLRDLRRMKTSPGLMVFGKGQATIDDDDLPVLVHLELRNEGGVAECASLTIEARPGHQVTAEVVRSLRVREMIREGFHACNLFVLGETEDGNLEPVDGDSPGVQSAAKAERANTRRRITDEDLQAVADAYRKAKAMGRATGPAVEIACGLTPDAARQRIGKARKAGYLEPVQ